MSDFSADNYFNSRAQRDIPTPDQLSSNSAIASSKFDALMAASQEKTEALQERRRQMDEEANSWVGKAGFRADGFVGTALNTAASLVSGTSRTAGHILSAFPDTAAGMLQANLTEQDIAALGRHAQGKATPEDLAVINRKVAPIVGAPPTISDPTQRRQYQEIEQQKAQAMADANPNSATPLSIWGQMNKAREVGSRINKNADNSSIVYQGFRRELGYDLAVGYAEPAAQMEAGWEALKASGGSDGKADTAVGLAKLIFNAGGAIASNPKATFEYVAENLPQLMIGAAGPAGMAALSTSNVGYALDNYNKGIQKYQAENGGALPPEAQRQKMAWQTAQLALSEQAGDVLGLGLTKLGGKAADVTRTGFKESLKNVGKAAGLGVVTEAPTEGYQTYLEGEVTGKPSTGLEIYTGAAIGAAAGAGLSGGGRAVAEVLGATPEQVAVREKAQATTQAKRKLVDDAIASGDVSALLDSKSPSFAPDDAMGALIGNAQLETTTQDAKDAHLVKGQEIITSLETRRKEAQDFLETNTVEGMKALQAQFEAKLATAAPGSALATQLTAAVESNKGEVAKLEATLATPEGAKQYADAQAKQTRDIAKMDAQIERSKAVYGALVAEVKPAAFVARQIDTITAPVSEDPVAAEQQVAAKIAAVDEVINLSMASPDRVSDAQLNQIIDAEDLPENKRSFLRQFQAARLAENALRTSDLVTKEVLDGTKNSNGSIKNWGIKDYREQLAISFGKKDEAEISRLLTQLTAFQIDHEAKQAAYAKALALGNGDQIQRAEGSGNWFVATPKQKISSEALKVNGGLYATSSKLLEDMRLENAALDAFAKQYDAALNLVGTTESSNVQNAAQAQSTGVQATTGSPGVTGVQATTPGVVSQSGTEAVLSGGSVGSGAQPISQPAGAVNSSAVGVTPTNTAAAVASVAPVAAKPAAPAPVVTEEAPASTVVTTSTPSTGVAEVAESTDAVKPAQAALAADAAPVAEEETVVVEGATVAPVLSVLATKSPEGTEYGARNLLADFFTQAAERMDSASKRPLASVQNFWSQVMDGTVKVTDYLKSRDPLTSRQDALLKLFDNTTDRWNDFIRMNLEVSNSTKEFDYKTLMRFFQITDAKDGKLDLDENVKAAIVLSGFLYVADNAKGRGTMTDKEINSYLGRDSDAVVSKAEKDALGYAGMSQQNAIKELGNTVYAALGLKQTSGPQNLEPQIKAVLGAHALAVLLRDEQLGFERHAVSIAKLNFGKGYKDENVEHYFYRFKRTGEKREVLAAAQRIVKANKDTGLLMHKLFGVEAKTAMPSFSPITYAQKFAAHTKMLVPKSLRKALTHSATLPWELRQDMYNLYNKIGRDAFLEMMGIPETSVDNTHENNKITYDAQHDSMERALDDWLDFVENHLLPSKDSLESQFYFTPEAWKNHRTAGSTEGLSPQQVKPHRYMLSQPAWKSVINKADTAKVNKFLIAVGEAVGITGTDADVVVNVEALLQREDFAAGLAAIAKLNAGEEITKLEARALNDAVKIGGENLQTMDAMFALAQYQAAEEGADFTVQMNTGVDGVSNGVILSHWLLGAAKSVNGLMGVLNSGGIFSTADDQANYSVWHKDPKNLDMYEKTTAGMVKNLIPLLDSLPNSKEITLALWAVTGPLFNAAGNVTKAGRKFAKGVVPPIIFGSSFENAVTDLGTNFVDSISTHFEKIFTNDRKGLDEFVDALNVLIAFSDSKATPIKKGQDRKYYLSPLQRDQLDAIEATFQSTLGEAMKASVEIDYEMLRQRQGSLNKTARLTFSLYNAVLQGTRQAALQDKSVHKNKANKPAHDITSKQNKAIEKALSGLRPIIHSLFSQREGNLDAGLLMAKLAPMEAKNPIYESTVLFGAPLPSQDGKPGVKSMMAKAQILKDVDPGAAMAATTTHSLDSSISHDVQQLFSTLNMHDELVTGVGAIGDVAQALNRSTFMNIMEYSPLEEAYQSLRRTVVELARLVGKPGGLTIEAQDNLADALGPIAWAMRDEETGKVPSLELVLNTLLLTAKSDAFAADEMKFTAATEIAVVNQYSYEGQGYQVTDKDREYVAERLAQLDNMVPGYVFDATSAIGNSLKAAEKRRIARLVEAKKAREAGNAPAKGKRKPVSVQTGINETGANVGSALVDENVGVPLSEEAATAAKETPFGKLGKASIKSDKDLVDFFKANPVTTAEEVIAFLSQPGRLSPINRKILYLVSKVIRKDMQIKYITKDSKLTDVLEKSKGNARGWYVSNREGEAIYFTGVEFAYSGLTAETVLHELLHGALARTVNAELLAKLRNDKHNTHAYQLVKELEDLRVAAQKYVTDNKLTGFADALSNVQEFITWGITNQEFQDNVLRKTPFESKTQKTGLVKIMQPFIDALSGLLWPNGDKTLNNGLDVLISNVSGLAKAASNTTSETTDINQSQASPVDSYTTLEMHEALASESKVLDPGFNNQLRGLLSGIVEKLHGPFGVIHAEMRKTEAGTPMAVWLKALATGKAPFASKLVASNIPSSAQEDFVAEQVEATLRAALDGDEAATKVAYKELSALFTEASEALSPKDFYEGNDWANATPLEKGYAQQQYDLIFMLEDSDTEKNNYLARFAALGLSNQKFNKLLKFATKAKTSGKYKGKTITERLEILYQSVLEFLQGKVTKTWAGQQADQKMVALVSQLVDIEAKNRATIKTKMDPNNTSVLEPMQEGTKKMVEYMKDKAVKVASSKFITKNTFGVVRLAGAAARVVAGDRVDLFMDNLLKMRDDQIKGHYGMLAGYLKEVVGHVERFKFLTLATKFNEKIRKDIITSTAKTALSEFADSKKLTKEQKAAITAVFLRSGVHNLLGQFTMDQLEALLASPTALSKAIEDQEALITGRFKYDYITEAAALGYKNATGIARIKMLKLNSRLIASRAGTAYMRNVTNEEVAQVEPLIASLVALRSMSYMSSEMLKQANSVLAVENKRGQQNGVRFVLQLHQRLEQESRERLFFDNPALMQHGFTPETYNPYVDIQVVNDAEGKELLNRGYAVYPGQLRIDKGDTNQERKRLYVRKGSGLMPFVSGSMALKTLSAEGSKVNDGFLNPHTTNGLNNAVQLAQIMNDRAKEITTIRGPGAVPDFHQAVDRFMVPLFNESGNVVNWRYMMEEKTKDTLLERDNSFERLLGSLAGSIFDKESSKEQNYKVVEALKEQHKAEYATRHKSYVVVGPKSSDPKLREIWKMLPEDTKAAVRDVWGIDAFSIRADSLYLIFGHRKLSSATMFATKDKEDATNLERKALGLDPLSESEINLLQNVVIKSLEWMLSSYAMLTKKMTRADADQWAKRAGYYVGKGEGIWQAMVAETKDIIVVKTGVVMLGNIYSNFSMLMLSGVSIKEIAVSHLAALKGATSYHDDTRELARLRILQDTGYDSGTEKDIPQRILRLEDALARNPVKELIDAGLMPTIVEDVNPDDEVYGYKKDFMKATEQYVEKLPKWMRQTGKTIYMSHDGNMYKGLSRVTQLSDFVARYTLYQHMINRKNDPLSKKDAVMRANDTFVNYDYPMQPGAQYLDDMGFTPFMKYFLRIQKELVRVVRENPGKVLATILFNQLVELGPIVLDGSAMTRIGNFPIQLGAPKFFTVIDDLATVNTGIALFK